MFLPASTGCIMEEDQINNIGHGSCPFALQGILVQITSEIRTMSRPGTYVLTPHDAHGDEWRCLTFRLLQLDPSSPPCGNFRFGCWAGWHFLVMRLSLGLRSAALIRRVFGLNGGFGFGSKL